MMRRNGNNMAPEQKTLDKIKVGYLLTQFSGGIVEQNHRIFVNEQEWLDAGYMSLLSYLKLLTENIKKIQTKDLTEKDHQNYIIKMLYNIPYKYFNEDTIEQLGVEQNAEQEILRYSNLHSTFLKKINNANIKKKLEDAVNDDNGEVLWSIARQRIIQLSEEAKNIVDDSIDPHPIKNEISLMFKAINADEYHNNYRGMYGSYDTGTIRTLLDNIKNSEKKVLQYYKGKKTEYGEKLKDLQANLFNSDYKNIKHTLRNLLQQTMPKKKNIDLILLEQTVDTATYKEDVDQFAKWLYALGVMSFDKTNNNQRESVYSKLHNELINELDVIKAKAAEDLSVPDTNDAYVSTLKYLSLLLVDIQRYYNGVFHSEKEKLIKKIEENFAKFQEYRKQFIVACETANSSRKLRGLISDKDRNIDGGKSVEELKNEAAKAISDKAKIEQEKVALLQQIAMHNDQLNKINEDHNKQLIAMKDQNQDLIEEINNSHDGLSVAIAIKEQKEEKIKQLQETNKKLNKMVNNLSTKNQELYNKNEKLKNDIESNDDISETAKNIAIFSVGGSVISITIGILGKTNVIPNFSAGGTVFLALGAVLMFTVIVSAVISKQFKKKPNSQNKNNYPPAPNITQTKTQSKDTNISNNQNINNNDEEEQENQENINDENDINQNVEGEGENQEQEQEQQGGEQGGEQPQSQEQEQQNYNRNNSDINNDNSKLNNLKSSVRSAAPPLNN